MMQVLPSNCRLELPLSATKGRDRSIEAPSCQEELPPVEILPLSSLGAQQATCAYRILEAIHSLPLSSDVVSGEKHVFAPTLVVTYTATILYRVLWLYAMGDRYF